MTRISGLTARLNLKEPVIAYWLLLAKDGSREELKAIDKGHMVLKCNFDKENSNIPIEAKGF